ncbi:MAG: right-handed parallel beta-helix repeat-containing protein [Sedimentisphaerales bacterium]|nr:right-handed parallel beta-helix repeat-containing protein [Sedimentisphaerales bacterium]
MMKIHCLLVSFQVLLTVSVRTATGQVTGIEKNTFYVALNGNDSWSGRLSKPNADRTDGPFATLHAACRLAPSGNVIVQAGQYFFDEPLVLDHRTADLTIESAPGANVCLFGGRKIEGWKKDGERFYSATLPGVKEGQWDFRALIVNGRYCPRARLPEKGFFTHLSRFEVPWMSTTGGGWKRKPTHEELTTLKYQPGDIGPWLDVNNAELTIYHMWDESLVGLKAMDSESQTLTFAKPSGHPPGAFGVNKYVIWNIREGMTQPGQWYLDRTAGKLVYWPLPGEDMARADVIAPTIESIIRIRGTRDNPVKGITIRGLTLSVTTTPLETGGFGAGRYDGAVSVASAENCRLFELEIVNVGGQGIKASGDNLHVERCHVHHAGACGIRCFGTGCVVADNSIYDVGLTYPSAIALQGGGKDCRLSHNEIHDCPYTAINCGGERNHIEHNLIYRAMKELHDGGGIYCFAGKDLVLRGNFIRDIIDTGGYGASAYYLDERSENCLVEGNLSVGIVRPSHNHMAHNNTIRNNVFVSNADVRITFPKSSDYIFDKNIIHTKGKIIFENSDAVTALRSNVLFSAEGIVQNRKLKNYSRVGDGSLEFAEDNVLTDPMLIEYEKGKVTFSAESPALRLEIEPIDVSGAGPRFR